MSGNAITNNWVVISIWCDTQRMRYDFDSEAEAFKFAADRRKESRDRILIIDPGGYIHDLKDGTPYV
jgi:hypothetical protein